MIIDLIVAALVLISAAISFLRGFIRETLTIAGMVGGLFAAYTFGDDLAPLFRQWLDVDPEEPAKLFDLIPMTIVADGLAYIFIFIAVVIIISVISHFLAGGIKAMGLGPVDRTLGVVFGIARAVVLLGLMYLPFHLLMEAESKAEYFGDSTTFPYIEDTAAFMAQFLPSSEEVEEAVENVEIDESEIRKKLFDNQFLSRDVEDESAEEPASEDQPESGYEPGQREGLDALIEDEKGSSASSTGQEQEQEQAPLENRAVY
jgi:membrane protein required for colicin V production